MLNKLKTGEIIAIAIFLCGTIITLFSTEIKSIILNKVIHHWELIVFIVSVIGLTGTIIHILLRHTIDELARDNKNHQDEFVILKLQNSIRGHYFDKIFSELFTPKPGGIMYSVEDERKTLVNLLKQEWKHRDNKEIEDIVNSYYMKKPRYFSTVSEV